MKGITFLKFALVVFSSLFTFLASAQESARPKVIVIDPGHGGSDPGAIGINGIKESDVVLSVAKEVLYYNSNKEHYEIFLTRYTDTLISLKDRVALAKNLNADFLISLHCNHANTPTAKGIEIFVAKGTLTSHSKTAILLAYRIHSGLVDLTGIKARGVKFENFRVLRESIESIPSVLIELCFLSNPDEAEFLRNDQNIKEMARIILESI